MMFGDDFNFICYIWVKDYFFRDRNIIFELVNQILVVCLIGGVIFLVILIVIGLVGNVYVIYVYICKFKNLNYWIYVLWLVILDIFNCFVSVFLVIIYLCNVVIFQFEVFCKIYRFILYFVLICFMCVFVVIVID